MSSLLIASPKYSGLSATHQHSVRALEKWAAEKDIRTDVVDAGRMPVDAARDKLAEVFRASDFDRMLMVDAGVGFTLDTIEAMIAVSEAGHEFVACAVPLCAYRLDSVVERAAAGDPLAAMRGASFAVDLDVVDGKIKLESIAGRLCAKTKRIGGAMMMLTHGAFKRIEDHSKTCASCGHSIQYEGGYGYFLPAVFDGVRHGEDGAFCRRFTDAGGTIQLLVDAPLLHEGGGTWLGNFGALLSNASSK